MSTIQLAENAQETNWSALGRELTEAFALRAAEHDAKDACDNETQSSESENWRMNLADVISISVCVFILIVSLTAGAKHLDLDGMLHAVNTAFEEKS